MHNVLGALRYMAEHGGSWNWDIEFGTGKWMAKLFSMKGRIRPDLQFNQDELRAFLDHYDELSNKIVRFKQVTRER